MKLSTRKMVMTAILASLAFVLNTFVYFPQMAPFQHFVDVIAAALLGPWYACPAAFLCGPIVGGLLYRKTTNVWLLALGEVFGTGIIGALVAYPLMRAFYGLDAQRWYFYVPFYIPSAVVGAAMGVAVLLLLKRAGALEQMQNRLEQ